MQLDLLVDGGWQHLDLVVRAGDPLARRDTGLTGACAGCWWAGRREMECFQLHRQKGAKNAKKEESESFLKQKVKRLCKKEQQGVGSSA